MSKPIDRLKTIQEKLQFIEEIVEQFDGKVATILEDEKIYKPAIYMHFVAIAEQFNKLKNNNEHDYDNVNESIIENILRYHIEKMTMDVESAIEFLENR